MNIPYIDILVSMAWVTFRTLSPPNNYFTGYIFLAAMLNEHVVNRAALGKVLSLLEGLIMVEMDPERMEREAVAD